LSYTLVGENANKVFATNNYILHILLLAITPTRAVLPIFISSQTTILSSPHGHSPSLIAIIRLISGEDVAALRCRRMRISWRMRMR